MTTEAATHHDRTAESFLSQYDSDPDFTERRIIWERWIRRYAVAGGNAVDLGCGGGDTAVQLADSGMRVTGVDGSEEMIRRCRERTAGRKGISFRVQDLPSAIEGGPFDLVLASSLVEYLDDTRSVDEWLASLVKPGGALLLSLPNRTSIYRRLESLRFAVSRTPAYRRFVRRLSTPWETAERLSTFGLQLREVRYFGHGPALSRLARRLLTAGWSENLFAVALLRPTAG